MSLSTSSSRPLDIVIIGAGIGGLSAGIALQQSGHRVRLFDRVPQLTPAGAAISIWPNGVNVLEKLGLGEAIKAASGDMLAMSYNTAQGELLTRFSLQPLYQAVEQCACPIARTALQGILLEACGPEHVTLGVTCEAVQALADGVRVTFSDGQQIDADLVIAADGTHSRLRNHVVGQEVQRQYCGYVNWNGRIDAAQDLAPANEWTQFVGDHKRVSLMPMGNDQLYFFFDVPLPGNSANVREGYRDELGVHFADWAEPVRKLIERLDTAVVSRVEIHDMAPIGSFVKGRVVLLGDAAHPMAPDLGQGGCQAMEDAWVLARCLEADAQDLKAALASYDAARVERTAQIMQRARARSDVTHGREPEQTQAWYQELAAETGERVIAGLAKTAMGGGAWLD
ncbi:FAD-binding monooxygenase [Pseudomonas sp. M47T1]|uniref:FAD-dependent urate hydroxylase HpxO n=1 Tax=Pseudomonas sp. M47T1 TaxID=1179778 RepID=UPI0002607B2A|nr:FAD-dependent urate hydroxylase HpxO [Pseudomonas sp. M47T1]EIK96215.1 FAD-binding monooxygenase [Pseudomonas sp. M47T1]